MRKLSTLTLICVFIVALLLNGCADSSAPKTSSIKQNDSIVSDDTKTYGVTGKLPRDYPKQVVPVIPEAKIIESLRAPDGTFLISATVPDRERAVDFYDEFLPKPGEDLSIGYNNLGEKSGYSYSVSIVEDETGGFLSLNIMLKPAPVAAAANVPPAPRED